MRLVQDNASCSRQLDFFCSARQDCEHNTAESLFKPENVGCKGAFIREILTEQLCSRDGGSQELRCLHNDCRV